MELVARFETPEEAHLLRAYLESNGVEAHVFDEHFVQMYWFYSNAVGGVRVVVREGEFRSALELSDEYLSNLRSKPKTISVARYWGLIVIFSFAIGVPTLIFGRKEIKIR
ncbi:MAG: DUF2007 domain-containing protein [Verrucomicrobiota bacterium]